MFRIALLIGFVPPILFFHIDFFLNQLPQRTSQQSNSHFRVRMLNVKIIGIVVYLFLGRVYKKDRIILKKWARIQ